MRALEIAQQDLTLIRMRSNQDEQCGNKSSLRAWSVYSSIAYLKDDLYSVFFGHVLVMCSVLITHIRKIQNFLT